MIAYKFVSWDVLPLNNFQGTLEYKVKVKLINGEKLTRSEKNNIVSSPFFRDGYIKIGGWCFSFAPYMKTYLVKQHGRWKEYKAFDKTSLRKLLYGTIQKIVEIKD